MTVVPLKKPDSPAERAADCLAQAKRHAEEAKALTVATLLEGAQQAAEVTAAPMGQLLTPGHRERLARLSGHVLSELLAMEATGRR